MAGHSNRNTTAVRLRKLITSTFAFKRQKMPQDLSNSRAMIITDKEARSSEASEVHTAETKGTELETSIKTKRNVSYSKLAVITTDGGGAGEEYHEYDVPALELTVEPSEYETPMKTSVKVVQNIYETINDEEDQIYEEVK